MTRGALLTLLLGSLFAPPCLATPTTAWLVSHVAESAQPSSLLQAAVPFENKWQITKAGHFDITFTTIAADDLDRIDATAERAYRQLSAGLMHELSIRPLIVVYATRADLDRARVSRSFPGNREHLLWALDTPASQVDGEFTHELTHVFAFDIVPVTVRRDVPSWFQEGLAEFERSEWFARDLEFVRGLVETDAFPTLRTLPQDSSAETARIQKIVGHLAFDFLVARAGEDAVRRILISLRQNVATPLSVYLTAHGLSEDAFDREFRQYVRTRLMA
jgi:hypothetical protein